MVKVSLFRTAALAALAIAGATAVPAQAQHRERGADVDQTEMRQARVERQEARQQARAEYREQRAQAAPQVQVQAAPQQRAEGGWRGQRAAGNDGAARTWSGGDGQRAARTWNRGDTTQQATRSWRGGGGDATVSAERNRTYSDQTRNRTYRAGSDGYSSERQQAYRQGYRSGSTADSYRDRRDQSYAYRQGYSSGSRDTRRWDRNDWRRDSRYNWSGYRSQHRDLFRAGRYYSPSRSYNYSRVNIGFFLDSGFYGNRYWINDPWQYRLPEVYGPYRWVRYYDDVLLVDIYSGEVVDVIRDFFW